MPNLPISGLPAAGALTGAEPLATEQAGVTVQTPVSAVAALGIPTAVAEATAAFHPGYVVGKWYLPHYGTVGGGGAVVANQMTLFPFVCPYAITIDQIGVRITTLSAGGNCQVGIYASDPVTKLPTGNALANTGNISTGTATAVAAAWSGGGNVSLQAGQVYWFGFNCDNSVAIFAVQTNASGEPGFAFGNTTMGGVINTSIGNHFAVAGVTFGTWPNIGAIVLGTLTTTATWAMAVFHVLTIP